MCHWDREQASTQGKPVQVIFTEFSYPHTLPVSAGASGIGVSYGKKLPEHESYYREHRLLHNAGVRRRELYVVVRVLADAHHSKFSQSKA